MTLPLITDHCSLGTFPTTIDVKKEVRGGMATQTAKTYTEAEKDSCSLDAMMIMIGATSDASH